MWLCGRTNAVCYKDTHSGHRLLLFALKINRFINHQNTHSLHKSPDNPFSKTRHSSRCQCHIYPWPSSIKLIHNYIINLKWLKSLQHMQMTGCVAASLVCRAGITTEPQRNKERRPQNKDRVTEDKTALTLQHSATNSPDSSCHTQTRWVQLRSHCEAITDAPPTAWPLIRAH